MHRDRLPPGTSLLVIMLLSVVAYSQTGQLRGKVLLKSADGKEVPVGNAQIDVFRMDLVGDYHVRTDKRGEFIFAGLPYFGTYLIAASAEGAKPAVINNVRAGLDVEYELVLEAGDGKRLTREEATDAASVRKAKPAIETQEQIKERAFREGNMAFRLNRYDEAIRLYEEGTAAIPPEPALFTNLAAAFRQRGLERYNSTRICCNPEGVIQTLLRSAQSDFRKAVEASTRAVELIRTKPVAEDENVRQARSNTTYLALRNRAEAMILLVTKVDSSQATAAVAAIQDYLEVEDDPYKKSAAELEAARMLLESKNTNLALERYRELLVRDPDNPDALAGFGLALLDSGDRQREIEARGYLLRFMDQAPESHGMRPVVAAALKKMNSHP